ncbi:MAG: hypothetical protein NT019_02920 [Candidatus Adlerbacteria bacterium]|nr:hypothetical protein [Candidatus Adlerbacteria bacterium]
MFRDSKLVSAAAVLFVLLAFLFSWWPFALVGVVLAALCGRAVTAVVLALVLDCAYGVPSGYVHVIFFPFTFLALCIVSARAVLARHMR